MRVEVRHLPVVGRGRGSFGQRWAGIRLRWIGLGGIRDGCAVLRPRNLGALSRRRRLEVGHRGASRVDQLAHLLLHLRRLRRSSGLSRRRGRGRRRAVGAERDNHHLPDHVFGFGLAGHQRVLDDRHHAVGARWDEARLDRVEQIPVDLDPVERRLVERSRHVAGRVVLQPQVGAHAEQEDVAQDRSVRVIADDLGNLRDFPPAVRHAGLMDDEVDRGRDLSSYSLKRYVDRGHHHHRLETRQRVPRGVGVDGRHRTVVTGVHRLQHVEGLSAADLTDQDAVGAHPEAVAEELPDGQLAPPLNVGGAVLESDDVRVVDLQLGRVLDRDHALVVRDEPRDHVERGGLT